jgi:hypothetical protein
MFMVFIEIMTFLDAYEMKLVDIWDKRNQEKFYDKPQWHTEPL